ncbi:MAG TPA: glutamine amidotransferase [Actinocrinis sp.]|uniref:type 1 glutamine amidotransferase n=1 Tax=Actinocrinis sp. TaxID=1920516 RepID=UPI002DDD9831|nr:glutamine amidotransferase [Actinocrinis sp.]HEV2343377.1 glutamine amidotransferase [Actinocrinis sp.]
MSAFGVSALRIVWIYPDLLSTYGDQGNALILAYRAKARGHRVERVDVRSDQAVPSEADIYLIGGGEDRPQRLAAERLRRDPGLKRAAQRGAVVLAVCAGFQLMGHAFYDEQDGVLPGLGLIDVTSHRGTERCVGEVVADVDAGLSVGGKPLPALTGFENHMGTTLLGSGVKPLGATVRVGHGNGAGTGVDGAHVGKIAGTYLHGPVLARNPALADLLLSWADGDPAASPVDDAWALRLRGERLTAVGA